MADANDIQVNTGVSTQHLDYVKMLSKWSKMQDVTSCQDNIHDKDMAAYSTGGYYLPALSRMTQNQYDAFVKRASFVMFTKRTVEAFVGMVMRKDVNTENLTLDNIDGKGGDINTYVENLLEHFLIYRRCGTLVDVPKANKEEIISVADAEEANIFPRLLFYSSDTIINWKTKLINNVRVLSTVVLKEIIDVSDNEFETEEQFQYRVLDLDNGVYRQRLFDNNGVLEEEHYPEMGGSPLKYIPFIMHGGITLRFPLLLAVANENIAHYKIDADYKHGLHMISLPTPYRTGLDPESAKKLDTVGPTVIWDLPEGSTCGYMEFTGAGIREIREAKAESVDTIVILASRILAPQKSSNDESALAAAIRNNAETSTLAGVTRTLSNELTEALKIAEKWDGNDSWEDVDITINSDFMPSNLSGTDMLSYVTAWIKGGISYDSLFTVLKRGEIIKGDKDLDDEFQEITDEQKQRLADEVDKADQMGEVEGKSEEDDELVPSMDVEPKQDLKLK